MLRRADRAGRHMRLPFAALLFLTLILSAAPSTSSQSETPTPGALQIGDEQPTPTPTPEPTPTPTPEVVRSYEGEGWSVSWDEGWGYGGSDSRYPQYDLFCELTLQSERFVGCMSTHHTDQMLTSLEGVMDAADVSSVFAYYRDEWLRQKVFASDLDPDSGQLLFDQNGEPLSAEAPDFTWGLFSFFDQEDGVERAVYIGVWAISASSSLSLVMVGPPAEEFNAYAGDLQALIDNVVIGDGSPSASAPSAPGSESNYVDATDGWSVAWDPTVWELDPESGSGYLGLDSIEYPITTIVQTLEVKPILDDTDVLIGSPQSCVNFLTRKLRPKFSDVPGAAETYNLPPSSDTRANGLFVDDQDRFWYVDCQLLVPRQSYLAVYVGVREPGITFDSIAPLFRPILESVQVPSPATPTAEEPIPTAPPPTEESTPAATLNLDIEGWRQSHYNDLDAQAVVLDMGDPDSWVCESNGQQLSVTMDDVAVMSYGAGYCAYIVGSTAYDWKAGPCQ